MAEVCVLLSSVMPVLKAAVELVLRPLGVLCGCSIPHAPVAILLSLYAIHRRVTLCVSRVTLPHPFSGGCASRRRWDASRIVLPRADAGRWCYGVQLS